MRHLFFLSALLAGSSSCLFAEVNSGLLALIPGNSKAVAGVQVDNSRNSTFGQFVLTQLNQQAANDQGFQDFIQKTGFDPRQDVHELLLFGNGDPSQPSFGMVADATFDQARMESLAKAQGNTVQTYEGVDIIVHANQHTTPNGSKISFGIGFIDSGVIAAGDLATVQSIIAGRSSPTSVDPSLLKQIGVIGNANDAWFVSLIPGAQFFSHTANSETTDPKAQALESILQSNGGVQFSSAAGKTDQVIVSIDAIERSSKDAEALADVIRFGASMLQAQQQNDQRSAIVAKALSSLILTTNGSDLHLSVSLAEKDLEQLSSIGSRHAALHTAHRP